MNIQERITGVMIPSGPNGEVNLARAQVAAQFHSPHIKGYLISGYDNSKNTRDSNDEGVMYRTLLEAGIRSDIIHVEEQSKNSLENYFDLIEAFLEDTDNVGICTDSTHFKRFNLYHKVAFKEQRIPSEFYIHNFGVDYGGSFFQRAKRRVYGEMALFSDKILVRNGLDAALEAKKSGQSTRHNITKKVWH